MLNKNVEVFMGCDTGWHFASTVLFGAPFDSTTSYRPGTRLAALPSAANPTALKATVLIRTVTCSTGMSLMSATSSCALATAAPHWMPSPNKPA